jgi:aquaporin Z
MSKYVVEFLGTLFLVFVILTTGNYLAIGAALALGVFLGGAISGGSFNPAVTLSLIAAGKMKIQEMLPYIVVEILGGLAAVQLYLMFYKK